MKPHLMPRAEFFGSKGIVAQSNLGAYIVRDGNVYEAGVEIDVDTIAVVDQTTDNNKIKMMLDNVVYDIDRIREEFR
ncbi:hypothetical protein [Ammoniphilus resinae]|uniref:Uncharacterized protein n=1 Tax=Ammoniphilus resinae TaxID=861532 RepID=A0ABS4GLM5_9BACL|nr:hypothetical protein [Ammoniphilus resinae]MBP1930997.1 hypothetical protein [Ammoniphilus resinae]